jgi:hypothetical protein
VPTSTGISTWRGAGTCGVGGQIMVAMITRPWIGRRSRLDGPRRQRGRRRRAVVGQGRARHRVLGGALAGRTVPACSSSCSGGWTSSNAPWGSAPRPWFPSPGAGGSPPAPSPAPRTASAASSPLTGRQSATPAGARRPRSTWTPGQGPVPGPGRLPADRLAVGQRRRISWAGLGPWRRGGSPGSAGGRRRRPAGAKLGVVGHVRRGPHRRHRRPGPPWGPGARRGPAAGRRAR